MFCFLFLFEKNKQLSMIFSSNQKQDLNYNSETISFQNNMNKKCQNCISWDKKLSNILLLTKYHGKIQFSIMYFSNFLSTFDITVNVLF